VLSAVPCPTSKPLEEAADRVADLLRQAEAAEAAGRDATALRAHAFEIAARALQADPPWKARRPRLDGESDDDNKAGGPTDELPWCRIVELDNAEMPWQARSVRLIGAPDAE
jgi:hypothetical protein